MTQMRDEDSVKDFQEEGSEKRKNEWIRKTCRQSHRPMTTQLINRGHQKAQGVEGDGQSSGYRRLKGAGAAK